MRITLPVTPTTQVPVSNSAIIYRGKSQLNAKQIIVIISGLRTQSSNRKTGSMLQTYILLRDVPPLEALRTGADAAICGNCVHRPEPGTAAGSCYVNVGQGPTAVYRAMQAGTLPDLSLREIAPKLVGATVRLGSYGDPVAVPFDFWAKLLKDTAGHTGYTHQWRNPLARPFKKYIMASVETPEQAVAARRKGWRTFRVRESLTEPLMTGEFICPGSDEAGHRKTCSDCLACDGGNPRRASVVIVAHGLHWKRSRLKQVLASGVPHARRRAH